MEEIFSGRSELVQFFRTTDKTSDAIGQLQASVFRTFASISGYFGPDDNGDLSKTTAKPKVNSKKPKTAVSPADASKALSSIHTQDKKVDAGKVGLTIRIEINLPAGASHEDYDNIFKSLRANIIDA